MAFRNFERFSLHLRNLKDFAKSRVRLLSTGAHKGSTWHSTPWFGLGALATGGFAAGYVLNPTMKAEGFEIHPPHYHWPHSGFFQSLDHASVRRGYFVYKQVCAACHSMEHLCYRHMVGVFTTEEEAKSIAEEFEYEDGPDEEGHMFKRPGKLSDNFVNPYPNEEAARSANNGAYPPDLSYITSGRHGGEDYVFSILTGYYDPPAGMEMREDLYYNAYFPGNAIGMAQALYNDIIQYDDGTPATTSQLAKDVCCFLKWAAEPEFDDRIRAGMKAITILSFLTIITWYLKRFKWSVLKSRQIAYVTKKR